MSSFLKPVVWAVMASGFATPAATAVEASRVYGTIFDETNAMTLPTAIVAVVGTEEHARTDLDGNYSLDLPPGTYDFKISFPGYRERLATSVHIVRDRGTELTVSLAPDTIFFEDQVSVTAELDPETATEAAQLVERRRAPVITDNMGREEMRKNADSNAADAMRRVTGLSVVDNSYVFVRGLGERYSNTTLNGAVLPTTEPDKRAVPLDLFPTGLIDSVSVVKSYTPDKPADFTGGLVEIEPLAFPKQRIFNVGVELGGNSQATFRDIPGNRGGGSDWTSFDDGSRALPGIIPGEKVVRGSAFTGLGFTPEELLQFGRAFTNNWNISNRNAGPDQKYVLTYGDSTGRLGFVVSASYASKTSARPERRTFYAVSEDELSVQNDYEFQVSTGRDSVGGVANLAYRVSGNDQVKLENFYTNNSRNETRVFEGFNQDVRTQIRNSRLFWVQEGIFSSKLSGEHFMPGFANSQVDWNVHYSRATRDEPDLRETLYELNTFNGEFVLADESQSGLRMYNDLQDRVWQYGLDWSFVVSQWSGLPAVVKVGPGLRRRERDFASRRMRFKPRNTSLVDLSADPETLFAEENLDNGAFELGEETRNTDTYNATQDVSSAYAMIDLPFTTRWRLVGGARVERSEQIVTTFDAFAISPDTIESTLDDTDVLPGLNLIYGMRPDMNFRVSYSHSVNRPEFRELAPFEFTDVVGGRATVGNPDLQRALIKNFDVRWEWFPSSSEVVAASFFWKDFDNPIERVVQPTAQLRTSFDNALGASNRGFELEVRKRLTANFELGANYTLVDSEIELAEQAGQVQTSLKRPLAGQSGNLINLIAELSIPSANLSARALYNFFGNRITDVGSLGLPDIIEEGRGTLDVVVIWSQGPMRLRLAADNLTNADHLFTQGGQPHVLYQLGRSFKVGLGYNFAN